MRLMLVLMVGCWILLIPPGAGPDEPTHTIRGAAAVRGDWSGSPVDGQPGLRRYDIPNWVGLPDPGCYAFDPFTPASCLADIADHDPAASSVAVAPNDAPIWGTLPAGLGTLLPRELGSTWAPRLFDAALPTALVAFALGLAHRGGRMVSAAVLVALTPMVWFSIAVVNPSGLAIAGGLALWVGLGLRSSATVMATSASLLATAGWVALVLPRRDGLVWASLIVAISVLTTRGDPRDLWRWLRRFERVAVAGSATMFAIWAATASTAGSITLVLAPALIWIAWIAWRAWDLSALARSLTCIGAALVLPLGLVAASMIRPSGFNSRLLVLTVGHTGDNLVESVGVLGWLDTSLPTPVLFMWWALVGMLAAGAMWSEVGARWSVGALLVVVATVVSAWLLEMSIERYDGNYWQGRYSLPLFLGLPVLLGFGSRASELGGQRIVRVIVPAAIVVTNLSLFASVRRWGVGLQGSLLPWKWDTYDAPVSAAALMVVHVVASALLARSVLGSAAGDGGFEPGTAPVSCAGSTVCSADAMASGRTPT